MAGRLEGKVALVVGAGASGPGTSIGRAVALEFVREGAKLFAVDRDEASLNETVSQAGDDAGAHVADAADPDAMRAAVEACAARFGRIDVLHNNVGIMAFGDPVSLAVEDWDRVMNVNGRACFLACKFAVPHMAQGGGGAIVNVSSIAAIRSTGAPYPAYSASKAAILGLTRSLALEFAAHNIRVNCVVPGFIESPMMRGGVAQRFGEAAVDEFVAERGKRMPLKRFGTPEDVAKACAFLASEDAAYITGTSLVVDGGVTAGTVG